jgi:hypothetical protein
MTRNILKTVALAWLALALGAAAQGFKDSFDAEPADGGSPQGFSVYGEETSDRGVTKTTCQSGEQSAFVVADFSKELWGVIMVKDAGGGPWDLSGGTISAQVCAPEDLRSKQGVVGFKLVDADGSGYRTPDSLLFTPASGWQKFGQDARLLTQMDEPGSTPGLDLGNIIQYGIVFFDRGDHNKVITFFVDDLEGVAGGNQPVLQAKGAASSPD